MNHPPLKPDESLPSDAVWKLLDEAPPAAAAPRFLSDTLRAARLTPQAQPWWKLAFSPKLLTGLTAATAVLVISGLGLFPRVPPSTNSFAVHHVVPAPSIQDIADCETLIAAADHLDDFSDTELVSLIGF